MTAEIPGKILHDEVVAARAPWSHVVEAGNTLRIIDLMGNQAVDCILYNAHDPVERYSSCETIVAQRNIFLETGTQLLSTEGTAVVAMMQRSLSALRMSCSACTPPPPGETSSSTIW